MLTLVAVAGGAQAFGPTGAVRRSLAVAATTTFRAVVLVRIIPLSTLCASASDVASAVVVARAVAVLALVAFQAICCFLGGLLSDLGVNSSHGGAEPVPVPVKPYQDKPSFFSQGYAVQAGSTPVVRDECRVRKVSRRGFTYAASFVLLDVRCPPPC